VVLTGGNKSRALVYGHVVVLHGPIVNAACPVVQDKNMRISDLNRLLPSMKVTVQKLLEAMESEDLAPKVLETYRSPQRAAELAAKGTGIALSVHTYGAACDIVCDNHLYECDKWGCPFFQVLEREAKRLGLVSGARWTRADWPHVQGVTVAEQGKLRSMGYGSDSWQRRDKFVAASIARRSQ
jgi:hypothetical protein